MIRPTIPKQVQFLLENKSILFQSLDLCNGPVNLIFPEIMSENILELKSILNNLDLVFQINYAHKANKSNVFVKQSKFNNICMDVSSKEELINSLSGGFVGSQIYSTGIKNNEYLFLALSHDCTIVIDSIGEYQRCLEINIKLKKQPPKIIFRISDSEVPGRNLSGKESKFGLTKADILEIIADPETISKIELVGFHFHNDQRQGDVKSGYIIDTLELVKTSYRLGYSPSIIDIGGGLRKPVIDKKKWSDFVIEMEEKILSGAKLPTFKNNNLGLFINEKGRVSGREQLLGRYEISELKENLNEIFLGDYEDRPLIDFLNENNITIAFEPGWLLLQNAGVSLYEIIDIKTTNKDSKLVILSGNMYNLSTQMSQMFYDPVLVSKKNLPNMNTTQTEYFLAGNLCNEEDILISKAVRFDISPEVGDIVCFLNTAAYSSDFEDAAPHLLPLTTKFVVQVKQGTAKLICEDKFNPFTNDLQ